MKVVRVRTAGFCMGVGLALNKLDQEIKREKQTGNPARSVSRLLMLGPIIHNPQVLDDYARQGVIQANSLDEIHPGDTVVIRAHGIPRADENRLHTMGATLIDATCPKVKKAQLAIAEATRNGLPLYLFGEAEHPEVRGLVSYAAGPCLVFGSLQELQARFADYQKQISRTAETEAPGHGKKAVLAAQTTQERFEFDAIQEWLSRQLDLTILSTICDATRKRQEETQQVAQQVQAMIVVGGHTSGNTRRLADVVRACNVPVWHIETAAELPLEEVAEHRSGVIGVTAGASTPRNLVDEVQRILSDL